ncbi:MAG: hypothetical protein WDO70_06355 [Alphaproteobacteria bacterium]
MPAGVGIDYGQGVHFKGALQDITDAAALAGASAYVDSASVSTAKTVATNYMTKSIASLPRNSGVTFTITPGTQTTSGTTSAYTIAIAATATLPTGFMSLAAINTMTIKTSATAKNPVVTAKADPTNFTSSACDTNTIYWYPIPPGSDLSTYTPPISVMDNAHKLYSNTSTSNPAVTFTMTAGSQIGFAMKNVTCNTYGNNSYGGAPGSTHYFYSNRYPPSKVAYPTQTTNRALQVKQKPSNQTQAQVVSGMAGGSLTSNSVNAAPTCGGLGGSGYVYAWNDMGGPTDDLDYDDIAYTFSCAATGGGGAAEVSLIQ